MNNLTGRMATKGIQNPIATKVEILPDQIAILTPPPAIVGFSTSAKQLPDNHQVTVSNPTPATDTSTLATSAKQDTLLAELQHKADLTDKQPVFDEGNNLLLREILEQLVIPLWYDPATNSLKAVVTGSVTATVASTTVTSQGGVLADPMIPSLLNQVWSSTVRNLFI